MKVGRYFFGPPFQNLEEEGNFKSGKHVVITYSLSMLTLRLFNSQLVRGLKKTL